MSGRKDALGASLLDGSQSGDRLQTVGGGNSNYDEVFARSPSELFADPFGRTATEQRARATSDVMSPRKAPAAADAAAKKLGTFMGVYVPTMNTIYGVVVFLRWGWAIGEAGIFQVRRVVLVLVMLERLLLLTLLFSCRRCSSLRSATL